ncbi:FAD-dependent oxidoreductase [bacterium]|nr:FAD-dependent oxidoreductase [bacterium]
MIAHDVLIVGSGLAGLSAAIEAHDAGADVAILSKVHPVRSHSGAAQGGINAAIRPDDDWRDHRYDTVKGSAWLADQDAVSVLCGEAPDAIWWLGGFGAAFSRTPEGLIAQRPFGGQRRDRTCYAADKTGHNLLHTLYEQAMKRGVRIYEEYFVTRLVPGEGAWPAAVALDVVHGELTTFTAPAVILATGGAGRVFGQSSNALINTGDGVSLAWRAGLPVEDMEFFQTHPTGLLNGILMTEGCRGEGAYLVNAEGERFMKDYAPQFMELAPRDQVARAIQTEINEGRGFDDSHIHLDLRHLGKEKITTRLPQIREIAMYFGGVDPVDDPIPVRPTVHYTMGGIFVDVDGRTEADGVFAAGECACVSVHGANRLGGNSLLETIVFGRRAGKAAAAIPEQGHAPSNGAARDEHARIDGILAREGGERPAVVRREMEKAMRENFGVFKNAEGMARGLDAVRGLRERVDGLYVQDKGSTYNQDLVLLLQLEHMLDVAWMCAEGSLPREESRGGHFRTDFPKLDNERFLQHTLLRRGPDGDMVRSYCPVTLEDIEPLTEVKY